MKSTYLLFGTYLDNKPIYNGDFLVEYSTNYLFSDIGSSPSLFDTDGKKRQASFTDLCSINTDEQFEKVAADLRDCSDIGIIADYLPRVCSTVHVAFFLTRLLQMLGQLHRIAPHSTLHILIPSELKHDTKSNNVQSEVLTQLQQRKALTHEA